jgi:hypothetical protein
MRGLLRPARKSGSRGSRVPPSPGLACTSSSRAPCVHVGSIGHLQKQNAPGLPLGRVALQVSLAVTYFRVRNAHYHRRLSVSRSCSGWEGVVPEGYCHQAFRWSAAGMARSVLPCRPRRVLEEVRVRCARPAAPRGETARRQGFEVIGSSRTGN